MWISSTRPTTLRGFVHRSRTFSGSEYLGYLNRTCSKDPGPLLRTAAAKTWRDWIIRKQGKDDGGNDIVSIEPYHPRTARCTEPLAVSPDSGCTDQASGKPTLDSNGLISWRIVPVTGKTNSYRIISNNQLGGCNRFLSASSSCSQDDVLLVPEDKGSLQRWQLIQTSVDGESSSEIEAIAGSRPSIVALGASGVTSGFVTFRPAGSTSVFGDLAKCSIKTTPPSQVAVVDNLKYPYTTANLTNLDASTLYSVVVQCFSSQSIVTQASDPEEFLTPMGTGYPALCCGKPINSTSLEFKIIPPSNTAGITGYQVRYRKISDSARSEIEVPSTDLAVTLSSLSPASKYVITIVAMEGSDFRLEISTPSYVQLP